MAVIHRFRGEYHFLSNFYLVPIEYEGLVYMSVENAFQASKIFIPNNTELTTKLRNQFTNLEPREAKKLGRQVELRWDWELVKDQIMRELIYCKFTQHEDLRQKLLATGNAYLQEGNVWHDNYWGVCSCKDCIKKESFNTLGEILMDFREHVNRLVDIN